MSDEIEKVESATAVAEPEQPSAEAPAVEAPAAEAPAKGLGEEEIFDMFGVSENFEDTELSDLAKGLRRDSGGEEKAEPTPEPVEKESKETAKAETVEAEEQDGEEDDLYVPKAQYMDLLDRFEKQLGGEIGIPKLPEETATSDGMPSAQPAQEAAQVPEQPVAQAPLSVPLIDGYMISADSEIAAQLGGDPEVVNALNTVTKENNRLLATHVTQQLQQGLYAQMIPAMVQLFPALMASAHLCEMAPQMESHPKLAHLIIEDEARKNPELVNRPRQLAQKALDRLNIEIPKGERRAKQAQDNRTTRKGPGRFATRGTPASNRDSGEKPRLSIDQQIDQSIAGGVVGAEFMDEL